MRAFVSVLVKDLRIRFASPIELVFFIVLPLVFTIVLAGAGGAASDGARRIVLVEDTVSSPASRGVVALLGRDPGLDVREVSDPTELLENGAVDLLLTLKPSTRGKPFDVTVRLSPWHGGADQTAQRVAAALAGGAPTAPAGAAAADATTASASDSAAATGSAGQIVTWVLAPLLGLGASFIGERRRGTLRRALASPASRSSVMAGTAAAEMLGAFVQVGLLALFGAAAFRLPWLAHPAALVVLDAALCAAGAALGSFLGTFCSTQRQAGSLGIAAAMVLAVLGGCWYPASRFPATLRTAVRWNPAGWAMEGFLAALSPGPATTAFRDAGMLAAFAAAMFLLTAVAFRVRRASGAWMV